MMTDDELNIEINEWYYHAEPGVKEKISAFARVIEQRTLQSARERIGNVLHDWPGFTLSSDMIRYGLEQAQAEIDEMMETK